MHKRGIAFFLALILIFLSVGGDSLSIYAEGGAFMDELPGADTASGNGTSVSGEDVEQEDEEEEEIPTPTVSGASVQEKAGETPDDIDLRLSFTVSGSDYVQIKVYEDGSLTKTENVDVEGDGISYYDFEEVKEAKTYRFLLTPYYIVDAENAVSGETASVSIRVPWRVPVLSDVSVEYDLERNYLDLRYEGTHIVKVLVYEESEKEENLIAEMKKGRFLLDCEYKPQTVHSFIFVPINDDHVGVKQTVTLSVEDYVATVSDLSVEYNEETHQIVLEWDSENTDFVTVLCNDVELASLYKQDSYSFKYVLQPGGSYEFEVVPYNYNKVEGESRKEKLDYGSMEDMDEPDLTLTAVEMKDKDGKATGFFSPAVEISWEAQKDAVYEIYRSKTGKKTDFNWLATVTAQKTERFVYQDSNVDPGDYYYKIRRIIKTDEYLSQELSTALSEASTISTDFAKPKLSAALDHKNQIVLTILSEEEYVTGYELYKKAGRGKYELLAVVTGDSYTDKEVSFGVSYSYKARPFYYQVAKKTTYYGEDSKVCTIVNTIGTVEAKAELLSQTKAKLSWKAVSNAQGYEIYYRSDEPGDSYVLLATTKKKSLTVSLKKGKTYYFQIKAYGKDKKEKNYYSQTELSVKTGFSKPADVCISKTSYQWNAAAKSLLQKDTLKWSRVYGASGYTIERFNEETGLFEQVAQIKKASTTSYAVTNAVTETVSANSTGVLYRVMAVSGSKKEAGEPLAIRPQLAATGKVTTKIKAKGVQVSWKPVTGAESYRLYRSNGHGRILLAQTDKTTFLDSAILEGVDMTYYVESVNKTLMLESEPCASAVCRRDFAKVSSFKAKAKANGTVKLSWKKTKNAKGYIIYCAKGEKAKYVKLAQVKAGKNTYIHKNAGSAAGYRYRIASIHVSGAGMQVQSPYKKATVKAGK